MPILRIKLLIRMTETDSVRIAPNRIKCKEILPGHIHRDDVDSWRTTVLHIARRLLPSHSQRVKGRAPRDILYSLKIGSLRPELASERKFRYRRGSKTTRGEKRGQQPVGGSIRGRPSGDRKRLFRTPRKPSPHYLFRPRNQQGPLVLHLSESSSKKTRRVLP
jgi:hypothetical protein